MPCVMTDRTRSSLVWCNKSHISDRKSFIHELVLSSQSWSTFVSLWTLFWMRTGASFVEWLVVWLRSRPKDTIDVDSHCKSSTLIGSATVKFNNHDQSLSKACTMVAASSLIAYLTSNLKYEVLSIAVRTTTRPYLDSRAVRGAHEHSSLSWEFINPIKI